MHLKKIKFFIFLFLFFQNLNYLVSSEYKFALVKIKDEDIVFEVEIADTKEKRERGLMFRSILDENKGMLFILPEKSFANIWMKNTILSLDILFISEDNIIVDLVKEAFPLSEKIYTSKMLVKYILEINAGLIDKAGIKIGDSVKIEY
tara:strand:+ start:66 stop:509 length:444 start_codon:yes stop_codon:yes gene_type:complete